ncbi:MAG: hypothetical protein ABSH20_00815 [Tepidisphaeraceae bacterium]|jgi:hypothetical protein
MPPKELIDKVDAAMERLASWKGHLVKITESLSRSRNLPCPHDRHFATHASFTMRLDNFMLAISGTRMSLTGTSGDSPASYELTLDRVVVIDNTDPDAIVIVEHFEQETERESTFRRQG